MRQREIDIYIYRERDRQTDRKIPRYDHLPSQFAPTDSHALFQDDDKGKGKKGKKEKGKKKDKKKDKKGKGKKGKGDDDVSRTIYASAVDSCHVLSTAFCIRTCINVTGHVIHVHLHNLTCERFSIVIFGK